MAGKKADFDKLVLGTKRNFPEVPKPVNIENAVKQIHEASPEIPEEKEKTSRVSVDTPVSMLKQIKRKMLDRDIKYIKDYFLDLARKDLEKE